jgi:hypothetical protein
LRRSLVALSERRLKADEGLAPNRGHEGLGEIALIGSVSYRCFYLCYQRPIAKIKKNVETTMGCVFFVICIPYVVFLRLFASVL